MIFRIRYGCWWIRDNWAMVFFRWVWFNKKQHDVSDRHFRHELQHCYQIAALGFIRFFAMYLWYLLRHGYRNNPFEVEARAAQHAPLTKEQREWKKTGRIRLCKSF